MAPWQHWHHHTNRPAGSAWAAALWPSVWPTSCTGSDPDEIYAETLTRGLALIDAQQGESPS